MGCLISHVTQSIQGLILSLIYYLEILLIIQ